jgi:hypothetical protein
MDGHDLVIEPKYKNGRDLMEIGTSPSERAIDPTLDYVSVRNSFWSKRLQANLYICNEKDGSICAWVVPYSAKLSMLLDTMDCSYAWGLEQEYKALQLLGTLIKHHQLKMYILTGMFAESSPRSGLMYIFRRLKPTLAISTRTGNARCIAALCSHPIGYYGSTWAGVMTPTDEIVAHLMLKRSDEHYYWRSCNQHHPQRPEAGV